MDVGARGRAMETGAEAASHVQHNGMTICQQISLAWSLQLPRELANGFDIVLDVRW